MSNRNEVQIETILKMRDEEGRTYGWIATQLGISEPRVRKIYHREKAKQVISRKQEETK